ncbi:MAG: hypothetical protein NC432_10980 [Roseburia sp.]|nr:hypothetical protein [Roseburia sp.]MCM1099236.1 hypothetical protein [Ruminococcus flavefaciens]
MDKYEYKVRADEIKELIAEGEYAQAAEIADAIDWRRVKSVMMLCTVSDLYKINRRYEDAKNMLLLAYERRPGGKTICYSLCELYIKTGDLVKAVNYFKEFIQVAPKDSGRYILQYKIYEAQEVSLEERIGVLEELKKRDYREKWAYELAYLYHRVGLATRCVEECDELILWFGEGKYVIKAMELKMLHQPLTAAQQEKYEHRFDGRGTESGEETAGKAAEAEPPGWYAAPEEQAGEAQQDFQAAESAPEEAIQQNSQPEEMEIQVKMMDVGQYNTINLQAELAAGLREVLDEEKTQTDVITRSILAPLLDADTKRFDPVETRAAGGNSLGFRPEVIEESEVFFGETGEMNGTAEELQESGDGAEKSFFETGELEEEVIRREADVQSGDAAEAEEAAEAIEETDGQMFWPETEAEAIERTDGQAFWPETEAEVIERTGGRMILPETESLAEEQGTEGAQEEDILQREKEATDDTGEIVMRQLQEENRNKGVEQVMTAQPPEELARVLSQEPDGQLSLVVPEKEPVEKQITGQMNISDILIEWERMKKENAEKRREEVRQHVRAQTGTMFTEFEASVRDGLLEKLESGRTAGLQGIKDGEEPEIYEEGQEGYGENPEIYEEDAESYGEESENDEEIPGIYEEAQEAYGILPEDEENSEIYGENPEACEEQQENEAAGDTWEAEYMELQEDGRESQENREASAEDVVQEQEGLAQTEEEDYGEVEELEEIEEAGNRGADAKEAGEEEAGETEESETDSREDEAPVKTARQPGKQREKAAGHAVSGSPVEREKARVRSMTREEKELYAPFIQSRAGRERLIKAIDNISMAAYTGNIIITGEEGMDKLTLAKNMIREVQMTDSNFSGKVAKIGGQALNSRNVEEILERLKSGALIIESASGMEEKTVATLHKALQQEHLGIIVVLEDTKRAMANLLTSCPELKESFTARIDMEAMSNEMLVAYGKQYAREMEYSIDDLGVLALHTRIEELQTIDHAVNTEEVKEIVDEAIRHANRKTPGHFFDILLAKRYDEEDMIILTEKDFA